MTVNFGGFPATLPGQDAAVRLSLLCARRLDGEAKIDVLIAADQTDWNPSGLSDAQAIFVTQYVGTGYKINSLAGGATKVTKVIINDDPEKNLTLKHQDSGSTAANRFNFTSFNGGSDIVLAPSYAAAVEYDPTGERWICSAVGIPFPLANDPGEDGALWYTGAGAPSASPDFGNDNDLYFDTGAASPDTAGNIWKKSGGSWSLISSIRGPAGSPGSPGSDGSDGADPGVLLVWDTGTSDANPGSGKIRANNASLASATVLYVSKTSKGGSDISAFLASLDDSTNTNKGDLLLTKPSDDTQAGFTVTGITDATGYVKVAVSGPFGATSFSAASPISFQFNRSGDKGIDGLGSGDMQAATYDPTNKAADAFSQDNMADGSTNKNFTATEKTKLAGISSGADVTNTAISSASTKSSPSDADQFALIDNDTSPSNFLKTITWVNIKSAIWTALGALIAGGTGKSTPVDADTLALSDSASSNATKKLTWANVKATLWASWGALVAAGTTKSTPVDGDSLAIADSAASSATKRLTWANLKATLKSYLDTLYQPLDSDLTTIAGLTATTNNFMQAKSSAWASRTPTQVTADLDAMVGDSGSGGTKGLVPAPSAGDSAASKVLNADGTWKTPSGGGASAGQIIQVLQNTYATSASLTTNLPVDNTIPQSSEGTQILSQAITPASSSNKILCSVSGECYTNGSAVALFRGSTCIAAQVIKPSNNSAVPFAFEFLDSPATASSTTYTVRAGPGSGCNTCQMNGDNSGRLLGGVSFVALTLKEVKG